MYVGQVVNFTKPWPAQCQGPFFETWKAAAQRSSFVFVNIVTCNMVSFGGGHGVTHTHMQHVMILELENADVKLQSCRRLS